MPNPNIPPYWVQHDPANGYSVCWHTTTGMMTVPQVSETEARQMVAQLNAHYREANLLRHELNKLRTPQA